MSYVLWAVLMVASYLAKGASIALFGIVEAIGWIRPELAGIKEFVLEFADAVAQIATRLTESLIPWLLRPRLIFCSYEILNAE